MTVCDITILFISYVGNMTCDCNGVSYLPVCADGQTYFSPCHAGCQVQTEKVCSYVFLLFYYAPIMAKAGALSFPPVQPYVRQ